MRITLLKAMSQEVIIYISTITTQRQRINLCPLRKLFKAAIEFAVAFYDSLAAGKDYEKAYRFGCNAIDLTGKKSSVLNHLMELILCTRYGLLKLNVRQRIVTVT